MARQAATARRPSTSSSRRSTSCPASALRRSKRCSARSSVATTASPRRRRASPRTRCSTSSCRRCSSSYARFLDKPLKQDPSCFAKKAIARALVALDCNDMEFFSPRFALPAARARVGRHGGYRRGRARELRDGPRRVRLFARARRAHGAPERLGRRGARRRRARDRVRQSARSGAAAALEGAGRRRGAAGARRVLHGLARRRARGVDRFRRRRISRTPTRPCASSRRSRSASRGSTRALAPLKEAWDGVLLGDELRRALLRAAAAHRSEAAFDWLLAIVADARAPVALEVVEALAIYQPQREAQGTTRGAVACPQRSDAERTIRAALRRGVIVEPSAGTLTSSAVSVDASGSRNRNPGDSMPSARSGCGPLERQSPCRGGCGARAADVATRRARASRRRDGRSRAPAGPRQPRHDGLRPVRQPAGRQRAVAGSARAVEVDRRARCRALFRPAERATP